MMLPPGHPERQALVQSRRQSEENFHRRGCGGRSHGTLDGLFQAGRGHHGYPGKKAGIFQHGRSLDQWHNGYAQLDERALVLRSDCQFRWHAGQDAWLWAGLPRIPEESYRRLARRRQKLSFAGTTQSAGAAILVVHHLRQPDARAVGYAAGCCRHLVAQSRASLQMRMDPWTCISARKRHKDQTPITFRPRLEKAGLPTSGSTDPRKLISTSRGNSTISKRRTDGENGCGPRLYRTSVTDCDHRPRRLRRDRGLGHPNRYTGDPAASPAMSAMPPKAEVNSEH